jgi:DNA polymerase III epsilon subunit-like protein
MSLRISNIKKDVPKGSVVIIYDIEGIGDVSNPHQCHIWNISAMVLGSPTCVFDQFIDPPIKTIPDPPNEHLFKVTKTFLKTANAQPCDKVLSFFFKWIRNNYDEREGFVILASHGNFRYDQPILQTEMMRYGILPPPNLYFIDTLHWFRSIKKGRESFSLSNLYKDQFSKPIRNAHLSLFDVHALHDLILAQHQDLHGIMYQVFHTSLLRIPSVGLCTESTLYDGNIYSLEHLLYKFMNECTYNPQQLFQELVQINVRPCIATTMTQFISTWGS